MTLRTPPKARAGIAAAAMLAATLLSCSDKGPIDRLTLEDIEAMNRVSKERLGGMPQKGPFIGNSSVVLYELDGRLAQKGRSFQGMTDSRGSFEIRGIELDFPYALFKADGFYRNEITGAESASQITLYAIADIKDKSSVNVNIMTHLEYNRVQALVDMGKSIGDAKRQAQGEILNAFGISGSGFKDSEDMSVFGASEGDAAMLAISVLLQGSRDAGPFSALIADISYRLRESGAWNNKARKAEIAQWAAAADLAAIRGNMLGWDLSSSVPGFEKYVMAFAAANMGIGDCKNINPEEEFCHGGVLYGKCGDANGLGKYDYDPGTHFCHSNRIVAKCSGQEYDPSAERCNNGVIERRCGSSWYSIQSEFCLGSSRVYEKCGGGMGVAYNPEAEKCCGTGKASKAEECCGNGGYSAGTHFCAGNSVYAKCGGNDYNPSAQFCLGGAVAPLCGGQAFASSQFCSGDKIYQKCGGSNYNPSAQFCLGGAVAPLCGGEAFMSSQFCSGGGIHDKCGGVLEYDPGTEACCGNSIYNPETHFCHEEQTYYCGSQPYNPLTHLCDARDEKLYRYAEIGTQTWMAENLNYNASGSRCSDNNTANCTQYGRLYNWATAMAGAASSAAIPSGVKGVCPEGWHLPSDGEWDLLMTSVGGSNTAGAKLKATSGWNSNGNGTDEYGFSALPGGNGDSNGNFGGVGGYGGWRSATEGDSSFAYLRRMHYDVSYVTRDSYSKSNLFSVRCVKD
jgi:uncharacterized protein (TIGR02145 family)